MPLTFQAQDIQINSYKNYDTKKGLASLNVRKIIQDKYGFIWCATQDGLSRFDGRSFVNFSANTVNNNFLLRGADVFDIVIDNSGEYLWVLTTYGGLNKVSIVKCLVEERYSLKPNDANGTDYWYKCLIFNKGYLYVGTNEGVLFKFSINEKKVTATYDFSQHNQLAGPIDDIQISEKGICLFSSGKGIALVDTGLNKQIAFINAVAISGSYNRSFFSMITLNPEVAFMQLLI